MGTISRTYRLRWPPSYFRAARSDSVIEISQNFRHALLTGLVVLTLSVVVGGDLLESVAVVAVLCTNIVAADIWLKVFLKDMQAFVAQLRSVTILIATIIPALISALLSFFGQSRISGLVLFPVGALLALGITRTSLRWSSNGGIFGGSERPNYSYLMWAALGVATVIFAWNPMAVVFVGSLALLNFKSLLPNSAKVTGRNLLVTLICSAGSSVAIFHIFGFQPLRLSWSDGDLLWDESMSWASQRHFLFENPFYAGEPFHIYQLGNLLAGDYSRILSLSTFEFLSGCGIVIGLTIILLVAQDLYSFIGNERIWFLPIVAVLCAQASFPDDWVLVESLRVPNVFGMGWALGGILIYLVWGRLQNNFLLWLFVLIVIAVALCKSPYLLNIALLIGGYDLATGLQQNRRGLRVRSLLLPGFVGLAALSATQLLAGPRSSLEFVLSGTSIFIGICLVVLRPFGAHIGAIEAPSQRTLFRTILFSTLCLGLVFSITNNNGAFHLMSMQFAICSIPAAIAINQSIRASKRSHLFRIFTSTTIIAFGVVVTYWALRIPLIRRGGFLADFFTNWMWAAYFFSVFGGCVVAAVLMRHHVVPIKVFTLVVVSVNFGLYLGHGLRQVIEDSLHGVTFLSASLLSDEQVQIGNWLKENSPPESIIASNAICASSEGILSTDGSDSDCLRRNRESWLSATSRRAQYVEAPLWSQLGDTLSDLESDRIALLNVRSNEDLGYQLSELRSAGVSYFVLDQTRLAFRASISTSSCFPIVFRSQNFLIFRLRADLNAINGRCT